AAAGAGKWWIEANENYQKGGWRNRCKIAGPNGPQTLTVPLEKGKHQRKPIQEVRISYRQDWWREHEQTIRTAYGRSPYFEFYAEDLFSIGRSRPVTLWELNQQLLETLLQLLQFPVSPTLSEEFIPSDQSGFLRPKELPVLPPYQQVFTDRFGYQPGLSVLDALFCLGPEVAQLVV
ncbi:MAG: WbqC family protein, partial [Bacteroidota bacterium]